MDRGGSRVSREEEESGDGAGAGEQKESVREWWGRERGDEEERVKV